MLVLVCRQVIMNEVAGSAKCTALAMNNCNELILQL